MKILHTSDWHIGRTFHTHSTLPHLREVLRALAAAVRGNGVDVVLVAGDVFDTAVPSADAVAVLSEAFRDIRAAGARIVMTSGNHDSVTRLGLHAEWIGAAGFHVLTQHRALDTPVVLEDEHGPVLFYGIPYLEPSLLRHEYPGIELRTHGQALSFAMDRIRADLSARDGARSVVLSHCFAGDVRASDGVERDILSGGLNLVSADVFEGPDYVALGHIHGRAVLTDRVRYSGAPLHYSFSEAGKPRGGWLVELDESGVARTSWLELPVPRPLVQLEGELEELLADERYTVHEEHWVKAVLTDRVRPLDAMRRVQQRFPHCAALEYRPAVQHEDEAATYAERVQGKTDGEVVAGFLEHVRNGVGPSDFERRLLGELLTEQVATEALA